MVSTFVRGESSGGGFRGQLFSGRFLFPLVQLTTKAAAAARENGAFFQVRGGTLLRVVPGHEERE